MTTEFISIRASNTVAEVMENCARIPDAETIYYLFVVDQDAHLSWGNFS